MRADKKQSFYSLDGFPGLQRIQENYQVIQSELKQNDVWMSWGSDDYDQKGHCQFLTGDWTVCPVYFGNYSPDQMIVPGMSEEQKAKILHNLSFRFPKTIEILKLNRRINFAAFTRLHPHSKLAPHRHQNPYSLIFHLGLLIPSGKKCGLVVADEIHLWNEPGDVIIFNDNLEHYAWNDSDEERILLYIDFLPPAK